jgi:hypothetical protein
MADNNSHHDANYCEGYASGVFEGAGTLNSLAAAAGAGLQKGFKMSRDEFVIEEADDRTILVRHMLADVRFLFVIRGRKLDGAGADEPKPSDLSLRNQARTFALDEARTQGWVD